MHFRTLKSNEKKRKERKRIMGKVGEQEEIKN
jgi:hypothetical protein